MFEGSINNMLIYSLKLVYMKPIRRSFHDTRSIG